ncbi:hypothetical protein HDU96_008588 [Phlyctochytrium bullatum]|nr:hypothetical protein HDU96_008588 [Phlyctochytrium bullatum]
MKTDLILGVPLLALAMIQGSMAAAPLEPADGKGPMYRQDSPLKIQQRFNSAIANLSIPNAPHIGPSLYQFSLGIGPNPAGPITENNRTLLDLAKDFDAVPMDVVMYITVDPTVRVEQVSSDAVTRMAEDLGKIVATGRKVFFRYAHEMNGPWVPFGGLPAGYIPHFRDVVTRVRAALPAAQKDNLAVVWAPNSCNGYPFGGQTGISPADLALLDTNKNGQLDGGDDPFYPFYPGDDVVDWVGLSMYDYGAPKYTNSPAQVGMYEGMYTGEANIPAAQRSNWQPCGVDFYTMFSGGNALNQAPRNLTVGDKPCMAAETGKAFYVGQSIPVGTGEIEGRRGWWRQVFNGTVAAKFPKVKVVSFFDIIKEESSEGLTQLREYSWTTAEGGVAQAFGQDLVELERAFPGVFVMGDIPSASSTAAATSSATATSLPATVTGANTGSVATVTAVTSTGAAGATTTTSKSGAAARVVGVGAAVAAVVVAFMMA